MSSVKKSELDLLINEVQVWQDLEIISPEQGAKILDMYEIRKRPLKMILLIAGCVLIGLGIISFIGAHWFEIPKLLRVSVIFATYAASVCAYCVLGMKTSKMARSLLIFGSFVLGAGIFLITRMYNYKLTSTSGTGWWIIAVLLVTLLSRDEWQLYLLEILSFVHCVFSGAIDILALQFMTTARESITEFFTPIQAFALIIALYFTCRYVHDRIANSLAMLLTLGIFASRMTLCFGGTACLIILVILGIALSFINGDAANFGLLMSGLLGLLLTLPEFWRGEFFRQEFFGFPGVSFFSVLTAVILATIMLLQIYRGKVLAGGVFFALLAARYFFDRIFDYMPKAWGFTITGIIFLLGGLFFERINRRRKNQDA